jgi:glycosyltransferase involved in cell wall biosynthesis
LVEDGIPVRIMVPNHRPDELPTFSARFKALAIDIKVVDYPATGAFGRIRFFRSLFRSVMAEMRGEWILHFNEFAPGAHSAEEIGARLAGVPAIVSTSHLSVLGFDAYNVAGRLLARLGSRCVDLTIVESQTNRAIALDKELAPAGSLRMILHGIPPIDPASIPSSEELRLNRVAGRPLVGSVGRLVEQKGYRYLLEAIALLRSRHTIDAQLVIAGEGPGLTMLQALARRFDVEDRVSFLGHREDAPRLVGALDVYVQASIYEGLPMALLEAMAAGAPIVATDVGGVRDAVVHGETGLLVPPRDAVALANALAALIGDDEARKSMGTAGRQAAHELFNVARMVRETEAVYAELLRRPRRGRSRIRVS